MAAKDFPKGFKEQIGLFADVVPGAAEGHRARMRTRLLNAGPDALADHEMLEMTLYLALPRRDTKPIARALLGRFGSYANVLAASVPELLRIEGLGEAGAAALKLVHAAAVRLVRAETRDRPVLSNWDKLMEYLNAALSREKVEQFRVLLLGYAQPSSWGRNGQPRNGEPHACVSAAGCSSGDRVARHGADLSA